MADIPKDTVLKARAKICV